MPKKKIVKKKKPQKILTLKQHLALTNNPNAVKTLEYKIKHDTTLTAEDRVQVRVRINQLAKAYNKVKALEKKYKLIYTH